MANNLINTVAKVYAGFLVVVTIIGLINGQGEVSASDIGVAATMGMVIGFGAIMIGELIFEVKIHYRRWKFMRISRKESEEKVEEAAQ